MCVVVQASSGHRLAAKQSVAVQVVAEFLQEAEDVGDAADRGKGQGVLLLLKVSCTGREDQMMFNKMYSSIHLVNKNYDYICS